MSDQKKTCKKIEDIISELLNGDLQQNALDFVAYLRKISFPFQEHPTVNHGRSVTKARVLAEYYG